MDYRKTAQQICDNIGGRKNIISAAHCATRLRLVIGDNAKCSKEAIEAIDGVKGVFFVPGQLQIIFGTGTVNKVTMNLSRSRASAQPPQKRFDRQQAQR